MSNNQGTPPPILVVQTSLTSELHCCRMRHCRIITLDHLRLGLSINEIKRVEFGMRTMADRIGGKWQFLGNNSDLHNLSRLTFLATPHVEAATLLNHDRSLCDVKMGGWLRSATMPADPHNMQRRTRHSSSHAPVPMTIRA